MSKTVLVVAAHADDEALGCGGTIAKHAAAGDRVYAVFVADGVTSRPGGEPEELKRRKQATGDACAILGVSTIEFLGLPDNRLDSLALLDIVQMLEEVIGRIRPDVVYTHHYGDLNVDHRITHQAAMTACRPLPGSTVREIYTFEVISSTEWNSAGLAPFIPNLYVDIDEHIETKLKALEAYAPEMRAAPHSRSLEHARSLAKHRGNSVGVDAAEAFMVMRVIE
jgi:LmbE family N-acetylglucosaminyl deacetylase